MKKTFLFCLTLIASLLIFQGCSDKKGCTDSAADNYDSEADEEDGTCIYVSINAYATHHGDTIINDSAYVDSLFVKFNATNLPGTDPSNYDLVKAGKAGEDHVRIEGLKRGKYFIFMTGWDPHAGRVFGGIPIEIIQTSGTINLVVPVVE